MNKLWRVDPIGAIMHVVDAASCAGKADCYASALLEHPDPAHEAADVTAALGAPVAAPRGGIVCFGSEVFHSSGPNLIDRMRRVYVAEYSPQVIVDEAGVKPWAGFEPFLVQGRVVAGPWWRAE